MTRTRALQLLQECPKNEKTGLPVFSEKQHAEIDREARKEVSRLHVKDPGEASMWWNRMQSFTRMRLAYASVVYYFAAYGCKVETPNAP